jgi:hypothetical protein
MLSPFRIFWVRYVDNNIGSIGMKVRSVWGEGEIIAISKDVWDSTSDLFYLIDYKHESLDFHNGGSGVGIISGSLPVDKFHRTCRWGTFSSPDFGDMLTLI